MGLDDLLGPLNFVDRIIGTIQIVTRQDRARNKYRASATEMIRVKHPWDGLPITRVRAHLKKYGVPTYMYTHDSQYAYFSVAKRQERWFWILYNKGKLWTPKKGWNK